MSLGRRQQEEPLQQSMEQQSSKYIFKEVDGNKVLTDEAKEVCALLAINPKDIK